MLRGGKLLQISIHPPLDIAKTPASWPTRPREANQMEIEIAPDSPAPMPRSGDIAVADGTATLSPPPSPPQGPASPSPSLSPRDDVLPLSPPRNSPARRRRSKPLRAAVVDQGAGAVGSPRRKRRGAGEPRTAASPGKNVRRARRRLDNDGGRELTANEAADEEAAGKTQRRKTAAQPLTAVKEKKGSSLALVPYPPINPTRGAENVEQFDWEGLWERVVDLVMWKNVGRSAFWFGSGSMLFVSSSFSKDVNFSPIKILCHFGVVTLVLAFFKDSIPQRQNTEQVRSFQLTEEDVLRVGRAVLPIANSLISMSRVIFSGDPSMTLKVFPILLFGAKYGHLFTVWRLLATGFFGCFTLPRLYSCYSSHIHEKVEGLNARILNAWKSCPRKKLVAAAAVTTFWNLVSVKTRVMAAFVSAVALRYHYQYGRSSRNSEGVIRRQEQQQAMVLED
ncbi:reticulon-like protein B17 isoform X4 [Triticum dicoccoides]|uniref:reticulon-like protein B17 isoform X4 n=1 Tax=Triticum dicoccoides TaxID=85692 RepID=UPI0018913890|nr:reticulon-like protein B17 isoform X4 [Triticum dicoccoides]